MDCYSMGSSPWDEECTSALTWNISPAPSSSSWESMILFYVSSSFPFFLPLPLLVFSLFLKYLTAKLDTCAWDSVVSSFALLQSSSSSMIPFFSKMFRKYRQLCSGVILFQDYHNWNLRALFYPFYFILLRDMGTSISLKWKSSYFGQKLLKFINFPSIKNMSELETFKNKFNAG